MESLKAWSMHILMVISLQRRSRTDGEESEEWKLIICVRHVAALASHAEGTRQMSTPRISTCRSARLLLRQCHATVRCLWNPTPLAKLKCTQKLKSEVIMSLLGDSG